MIILVSSIKGGTGKSTISFHLATYAHLISKEIITMDLDFPQFSFTHYWQNRKNNKTSTWKEHFKITDYNKIPEFHANKIYIIDTPGKYDEPLVELHKKADIIITPINDSFIDIDTIMETEHNRWGRIGSYYEMIFENKKAKPNSKWLVVRNRGSALNSKYKQNISEKLNELAKKLDFQLMEGLKERNIFRELFTQGLTVMDLSKKLTISELAAKTEIKLLAKIIGL